MRYGDMHQALSLFNRAQSVRAGLALGGPGFGAVPTCPPCQRLVQSTRGPVCISDPACHYANTQGATAQGGAPADYASAANAAANSGKPAVNVVIREPDGSTRVVSAVATNDAGEWFQPNKGGALEDFFNTVGAFFKGPSAPAAATQLPQEEPFYTQGWFLALVGVVVVGGVGLAIAKSK